MRESKNFCANYLTNFSIDLNGIHCTVDTCWCDEPHANFISSFGCLYNFFFFLNSLGLYTDILSGVV